VLAVLVATLAAGVYGATVSPLLSVDTLTVQGTSRLTQAQVKAAAGVHEGDAMVWIDPGRSVDGMDALPYVRDATLTRQWPHTVRITVHERSPAAWVEGSGSKALVDSTGRVLETVQSPPPGLPQLLGPKVVPPPGGTVDAVDQARVAGTFVRLAATGTPAGVAVVQSTPDHGVVVHLASGPEVRMGSATQIAVKIRAALAVLGASANVPVAYVDVSVPTNPVEG
jgi:cell division protein FtsQ